jgi:hypothetical protein
MTDHECIDMLITETEKGLIVWRREEDNYVGLFRQKDTNSSRDKYNEFTYILIPRPDKISNAILRVYEKRDRLAELVPIERKNPKTLAHHEKIYNEANYFDGLGFLCFTQSNSKTHKVEKAIKKQIEPRGENELRQV